MNDNPWDTVRAAMQQARSMRSAIDQQADSMAELLIDSLRRVSSSNLGKLKRELRFYDMHRGKWRQPR